MYNAYLYDKAVSIYRASLRQPQALWVFGRRTTWCEIWNRRKEGRIGNGIVTTALVREGLLLCARSVQVAIESPLYITKTLEQVLEALPLARNRRVLPHPSLEPARGILGASIELREEVLLQTVCEALHEVVPNGGRDAVDRALHAVVYLSARGLKRVSRDAPCMPLGRHCESRP